MKQFFGAFSLLFFCHFGFAQSPTVQDCLGAIPICQNQYSQNNAYPGDGNYHQEINSDISCLDEEYYSVWYTFTAQTSGFFRFTINPNTYSDDYDWAVFNLTNASCANIGTNPSLCISCNSFGDLYGDNGATGANSANGGTDSWNGPGTDNGPQWNCDISVTAGSTYALLICNWSQSTSGYSVNFAGSSAVIYDNVPPSISNITSPVCGDTSIFIQFSEYILCNSVQSTDFMIIGPAGNIPVVSAFGQACSVGGTQERFFTIRTNSVLQKGNYKLILSGPVNDLCGNTSIIDTIDFAVAGLSFQTSSTPSTCTPNGTATCVVINGQTPISYAWSNGDTGSPIDGLIAAAYHVTVTDHKGCVDSTFVIVQAGSGTLSALLSKHDVACYGDNSGSITASVSSGEAPYVYQWSNLQHDSIATNLSAGNYSVTITDHYGCVFSDSITINQSPQLQLFLDSTLSETCSYADGAIFIHADGGLPQYHFTWSQPGASDTPSLVNIHAGNYTVTVADSLQCSKSLTIDLPGEPYPIADFEIVPPRAFLSQANISFINQSENYDHSFWDFGDGNVSTENSPTHSYTTIGHIPVMLVVNSSNLCTDTAIKFIDIFEDFFFYIPNAFSPNKDGINEGFGPVISGGSESNYSFEIYSRWGDLVFNTNDITKFWDGTMLKKYTTPQNSFVYRIVVYDLCDNIHEYLGSFVLIR